MWPGNSVCSWCETRGKTGENTYVMLLTWRGNVSRGEGWGVWGKNCVKSNGRKGFVCEEGHECDVGEGRSGLCW